jgi:BASS family bile acid:Na+ symporter
MNSDRLINLFAIVTLVELMLAIGLGASVGEVWAVARDWRGVIRASVANYVLVPAAAVGLVLLFRAQPMVAAGVMVVAVCPGAPYAPPFTAIAKGRVDLAIGWMVILAGSSAVLAPLLLMLLLPVVAGGGPVSIGAGRIVSTLAVAQFLPLCLGLGIASTRPALARRLKKPLGHLSTVLNVCLIGVILAVQYPMLSAIRTKGYVGMFALLACSAAAGWLLARGGGAERNTLAITTSVRNVGVGLVIAGGSFPGTAAVTFTTAYALFQSILVAVAVIAIGRGSASPAPVVAPAAVPVLVPQDGDPRSAPTA